ncbi:alcohol dehydrogenase [Gammaproteobacteria bacterium]|nr:alcohol dehydrogenase [Gammaproteobacteria bacterium]
MKAIVYHGKENIKLETVPSLLESAINSDEVLIKVAYAGICGSDLNIYAGVHPRAKAPLIMGHEFSGVIEIGNNHFAKGAPVTVRPLIMCGSCLACNSGFPHVCQSLKLYGIDVNGGMAQYVKVSADKIHVLPASLSLKLGAFVEPLAVGVHAVKRAGFKAGASTVVFGAGTIGLCVASVLKIGKASQIIVVEVNAFRRNFAKNLGFTVIDPSTQSVIDEIGALTQGHGVDIAFDCAAHPSVAAILTKVVRVQGTLEIVGSYKFPPEFPLLDVEFKELTVIGTRVYTSEDFEEAITLITQDFPFESLITVLAPDAAQQGFERALSGKDSIKVMYEFNY